MANVESHVRTSQKPGCTITLLGWWRLVRSGIRHHRYGVGEVGRDLDELGPLAKETSRENFH